MRLKQRPCLTVFNGKPKATSFPISLRNRNADAFRLPLDEHFEIVFRKSMERVDVDKKSRRNPSASVCLLNSQRSNEFDVLGSRTLRSLAFIERNALAFLELIEANAFKVRVVEEHVFARRRVDESEAFVRQLLDRAFCHFQSDS